MFEQGLILMGAGMGVVGLFLAIMVTVMYGTAAVIMRIEKNKPNLLDGTKSNDIAEIAVAIAAVQSHSRG